MGVLKWARKAIQWLRRKSAAIKKNRLKAQEVARIITEGTKYQLAYEKFCERMAKVEATVGATTDFWRQIETAKPGEDLVIPWDNVKYAKAFKKTFDATLKK